MPEWVMGVLAALVGIASALLQWKGKRDAIKGAEGLTRQLTAIIDGVERTAKQDKLSGAMAKRNITQASKDAGEDIASELHRRVREVTRLLP